MITADQWTPAGGIDLEPDADTAVRETIRNTAVTAGPAPVRPSCWPYEPTS
jgi:hypothetical protein